MKKKAIALITVYLSLSILVSLAYAGDVSMIKLQNTIDFSKARSISLSENIVRFENVIINAEPHWIHYRVARRGRLAPIGGGELASIEIPIADISIDGNRSDWDAIDPLYTDPEHDQGPPDGHVGTDVKEVFMARDDEFIYSAFTLYDGDPPEDGTMYVTELQQYLEQYHTPGDTIIMASYSTEDGWQMCVGHRESRGCSYTYDSSYVGIGTKFIEYKVPIADIEYDGGGEFDPMGIEGRFIRNYVHYCPGEPGEGDTYDGAGEDNKLMIVNFY